MFIAFMIIDLKTIVINFFYQSRFTQSKLANSKRGGVCSIGQITFMPAKCFDLQETARVP